MSTEPKQTAGQKMAAEVGARLRARATLLVIVTPEERRFEGDMAEIAVANKFGIRKWDRLQGVVSYAEDLKDEEGKETLAGQKAQLPGAVLQEILNAKRRHVWILRDFFPYFNDPVIRRQLRSLAKTLQKPKLVDEIVDGKEVKFVAAQAIVLLTTNPEVPPDLKDLAVVIRWPLPDRTEIGQILDIVVSDLPEKDREGRPVRALAAPNGTRERAIEAAIGLSAEGAKGAFQKSLVTKAGKIDPALVAEDKRRIVSERPGLEWRDPDPRGMDAVGGLDLLKAWLALRRGAFSERARTYGLPAPKGIMLAGPPGGGKSLVCKAIASAWGVPLIRIDLPAMKGGIVGQSEANIRAALQIVEAVGPCVVWFDEMEKAVSEGGLDSGVSSDQLGTVLSWMQDRPPGAFVVAAVNRLDKLPSELLRPGRFDAIFLIDLPSRIERREIFRVTLAKFARDFASIDVDVLSGSPSEGFTGAEINSAVEAALFAAFADGEREMKTADILTTLGEIPPQSKSSPQVEAMRKYASDGKARFASSKEVRESGGGISVLDLSS